MAAYLVYARHGTLDQASFNEYRQKVGPTIARFSGQVIVGSGRVEALEGEWSPESVTMIRFESKDQLMAWYNSPEYAPLKQLRIESSRGDMVVLDAP